MSLARKYNNMVLGGKVCAAVWMATNRGARRPYCLHNLDSKSGCPVMDVLRYMQPDCRVPSDKAYNAYPDSANQLNTMPVYCYDKCIAKAAAHLSGSIGPCGVEAKMLKHWLLQHSAHLERLWETMANWVNWLSNSLPPYATYQAENTVSAVALDKCPDIRPLGVGEEWMRLWSDCSHMKTKVAVTSACRNIQLCVNLQSGIKANLHAIWVIWLQLAGWTKDKAAGGR
jgi:hypothetical protein